MRKENPYDMSNFDLLFEFKELLAASARNELDAEDESRIFDIERVIEMRMNEGHVDQEEEEEEEEECEEEN